MSRENGRAPKNGKARLLPSQGHDNGNILPSGWDTARIGDVLLLMNGYAFKPTQWNGEGLPIIRIQNLNKSDAPFNLSTASLPDRYRVCTNDLLFAWSGTPGTSFGAHIWRGGDAWLNQHIFRIEFDERGFDRNFLRHAINANLREYIEKSHGGAGLAHITKKEFESSYILLPPLAEQQRIVAALDAILAKVNTAKERLANVPKILKRFRQSVLAAACSGRLTADWREQNSGVNIEPDVFEKTDVEQIVEAPADWNWTNLDSLCDSSRGICYGVIKLGPPVNKGVPCLRTSDVRWLRIDDVEVKRISPAISAEFKRSTLVGHEVLVNVRGTLGGVAVVPERMSGWNVSREVAVVPVLAADSAFVARWVAMSASQAWLTGVAKGVAYTGINLEDLRLLPIAVPPRREQQEIVRRVDALFAVADQIEARYEKARAHVDRLTQAVLAKAFRGELVPTEHALAEAEGREYESATELLARIQATNGVHTNGAPKKRQPRTKRKAKA